MSGRRLYIGRVPQHATNRDFQDHFGSIGKLVETRIMAGFAFIEYDQLRDAEQAVQELNNKDFLNERILVEFAKPPRQMMDDRYGPPRGYGGGPPRGYGGGGYGGGPGGYDNYGPPRNPPARPGNGYRLTISGLGQGTSWQDLKDFGRTIGSVSFADVDRNDPTVGFIEFSSRRDADDALEKLDNRDLHGSVVRVTEERGSSRRDDGYSSRRDDDRRGDDRRGDDGYRSSGRDRDRYDDRERSSRRRSPTPEKRRSRSPERRRSRSPAAPAERERSPMRERSRSPARERRDDY